MSSTSTAPVRGGVTAATAASKAKASDSKVDPAAGKRKREALGEVTGLVTNNKGKAKAAVGKEKESSGSKEKFDGVVIKSKTTTTTTTLRQPLKPVGAVSRRTARTTVTTTQPQPQALEQVVEVRDEDAMAVDEQPAATRLTRKSVQSVGPSRRLKAKQQEEDAEATRVLKKRRTSSEAPLSEAQVYEEQADMAADLEAFANAEPEADPEGDEWDDLDAEDADDPLMVSEYVVEIFKYMKEVEVRINLSLLVHYLTCS